MSTYHRRLARSRGRLPDTRPVHAAHKTTPQGEGIHHPREVPALGGDWQQTGVYLCGQRATCQVLLQSRYASYPGFWTQHCYVFGLSVLCSEIYTYLPAKRISATFPSLSIIMFSMALGSETLPQSSPTNTITLWPMACDSGKLKRDHKCVVDCIVKSC